MSLVPAGKNRWGGGEKNEEPKEIIVILKSRKLYKTFEILNTVFKFFFLVSCVGCNPRAVSVLTKRGSQSQGQGEYISQ